MSSSLLAAILLLAAVRDARSRMRCVLRDDRLELFPVFSRGCSKMAVSVASSVGTDWMWRKAMSLRIRPLGALLSVGIILLVGFRSRAEGQQADVTIPAFQALKQLDYAKLENASQSDVVGYAELQDLINACKAYSKGLDALPRFHEPVFCGITSRRYAN